MAFGILTRVGERVLRGNEMRTLCEVGARQEEWDEVGLDYVSQIALSDVVVWGSSFVSFLPSSFSFHRISNYSHY